MCIKPCGTPPARCFLICAASVCTLCPKETSLKIGKHASCYMCFLTFHICFWRFVIPPLSSYTIPLTTVTAVNCHSQTISVSSPPFTLCYSAVGVFLHSTPGIPNQWAMDQSRGSLACHFYPKQLAMETGYNYAVVCVRGLAGKFAIAGI